MNNGIKHDIHGQKYRSDFSLCTYYFDSHESVAKIKALRDGKPILAFCLKELDGGVEVFITIPDGYECMHFRKGKLTSNIESKNAHLTYHGIAKRKKMTGEIHISSDGCNPLKGNAPYTEAPNVSSSNIELHPLPVCRIELSESTGKVATHSDIENYFELQMPTCFFNTIEVHVAKKGYTEKIASASTCISTAWASLFVYTSMHTYFLGKVERRPGFYPQVICLQTDKFELIILATREYKNLSYELNRLKYFHTKDYFRNLCKRRVIAHGNGYFIDQLTNTKQTINQKYMSDFL
ncbi:hypothetical protein RCH20_002541 [Psychrobacter sp. PL15]|uniref:hypothetical protein n=1 Tax=Psychrobacter sp. PL15 TaxID=3071719 RepID=UPI002E0761CE|nr:hypothetical protein [Psychrobacter sp. PL15]